MLDSEVFWQTFRDCSNKLPKNVSTVFSLREVDGIESKGVCAWLDISENNLRVMLHRARMALHRCLETNWFGKSNVSEWNFSSLSRHTGSSGFGITRPIAQICHGWCLGLWRNCCPAHTVQDAVAPRDLHMVQTVFEPVEVSPQGCPALQRTHWNFAGPRGLSAEARQRIARRLQIVRG